MPSFMLRVRVVTSTIPHPLVPRRERRGRVQPSTHSNVPPVAFRPKKCGIGTANPTKKPTFKKKIGFKVSRLAGSTFAPDRPNDRSQALTIGLCRIRLLLPSLVR